MSNFNPADSGYVEVNKRIEAFIDKYPEGSLQSDIKHLTDSLVIVQAWAYRSPDDPRPGMGLSQMAIPGPTSFTRGSEVENAETSAWGRAIAALGFEVKRAVATANEIRNKTPEGTPEPAAKANPNVKKLDPSGAKLTETSKKRIFALRDELGLDNKALGEIRLKQTGKHSSQQMTEADGQKLIDALNDLKAVVAASGGELVK